MIGRWRHAVAVLSMVLALAGCQHGGIVLDVERVERHRSDEQTLLFENPSDDPVWLLLHGSGDRLQVAPGETVEISFFVYTVDEVEPSPHLPWHVVVPGRAVEQVPASSPPGALRQPHMDVELRYAAADGTEVVLPFRLDGCPRPDWSDAPAPPHRFAVDLDLLPGIPQRLCPGIH